MIKHIPNTVTLVNLACGCLGVIYCLEGRYDLVMILMGMSLLADFADGLLARLLNARSELGVQLDSLADAVSFGVLPGTILYVLIEQAVAAPLMDGVPTVANYGESILRLEHLGFVFTLFAIVRLGKFNIDTRQTDSFLGLATPAAALFVIGLLMIKYFDAPIFSAYLDSEVFLIIATAVLAGLMISELPTFSFKVSGTRWKGNESQVIFLVLCVPLILFLKWAALPFVILLYLLISIVTDMVKARGGDDAVITK